MVSFSGDEFVDFRPGCGGMLLEPQQGTEADRLDARGSHPFNNGGSFWIMINHYLKTGGAYTNISKIGWLDFQGCCSS